MRVSRSLTKSRDWIGRARYDISTGIPLAAWHQTTSEGGSGGGGRSVMNRLTIVSRARISSWRQIDAVASNRVGGSARANAIIPPTEMPDMHPFPLLVAAASLAIPETIGRSATPARSNFSRWSATSTSVSCQAASPRRFILLRLTRVAGTSGTRHPPPSSSLPRSH